MTNSAQIVVVATPSTVAENTVRALAARARKRGAVLVPTAAWPGSDLVIEAAGRSWTGLSAGHGRLRRQELTLRAVGRGRAAQSRTTISMPPRSITGPDPDLRIPLPPAGIETPVDEPVAGAASPLPEPVTRPVDPWEKLRREVGRSARRRR